MCARSGGLEDIGSIICPASTPRTSCMLVCANEESSRHFHQLYWAAIAMRIYYEAFLFYVCVMDKRC